MKKTCANCVFFWSAGEVMADGHFKGAQRGECLVNPPQLMLVPTGARPTFGPAGMAAQQAMQAVGMSPSTLSTRPACKEHQWTQEALNRHTVGAGYSQPAEHTSAAARPINSDGADYSQPLTLELLNERVSARERKAGPLK